MNIITCIILFTILFEFGLHRLADVLNLRQLSENLPQAFDGYYDPERYRKSQQYLKVNTQFAWLTSSFSLILILVFWFGKGFMLLDEWLRAFGWNPIVTGLLYIGILMFGRSILSLPFDIYATFVIEEKFGFNKTTIKTFILDLIKGTILAIVLGSILISAVLVLFEYAGPSAWIYCWIAISILMLIIKNIFPTLIMPLFNKFNPIAEGELKDAIIKYAESIRFPLQNIYVMDGSKRSTKSNAFFTGFGKNKRIALFDTLIEQHTTAELVAILAHEMGHYKKKHILYMMTFAIIQIGVMLWLFSFFISYQGLFDAFYMQHKSVYAGLLFFGMLFSPISFFINIFFQMYSRKNEYEADRFSVETYNDPQAMATALKKLAVHNLSNLLPHPLYVFLNASHPPVLERINAIFKTNLQTKVQHSAS